MTTVVFTADWHGYLGRRAIAYNVVSDFEPHSVYIVGDLGDPENIEAFSDYPTFVLAGNEDDPAALESVCHEYGALYEGARTNVWVDDVRIFVQHGHEDRDEAYDVVRSGKCDYAVHGHHHAFEHTEVERMGASGAVLNPGCGTLVYDGADDEWRAFGVETGA